MSQFRNKNQEDACLFFSEMRLNLIFMSTVWFYVPHASYIESYIIREFIWNHLRMWRSLCTLLAVPYCP